MLDTPNLNIVLFEPEIPQNTGNIGRTCVLTNSKLHLIKPLGFRIDDKSLKRAGLDYWPHLDVEVHESFDDMIKKYPDANIYLSTTKEAKYHHDEVKYKTGDFIVFGRESSGLPEYIRNRYVENRIRVPMIKTTTRSLNLSNTVSIVAYEALRQLGFPDMK